MNEDLEKRQLRESIVALRDELERVKFDEHQHVQQAIAAATEEIRQLRATIVELRDQVELNEARYHESQQDTHSRHDREKSELHLTISILREKLEELNESLKKAGASAKRTAEASR